MLNRIEPLRNELKALEDQAKENQTKYDDVQKLISDLEHSIASYKEEYAVLISQAQAIKSDLSAVEGKVWVGKIFLSVMKLKCLGAYRACHPNSHYRNYNSGALFLNQVTTTHLKIWAPIDFINGCLIFK